MKKVQEIDKIAINPYTAEINVRFQSYIIDGDQKEKIGPPHRPGPLLNGDWDKVDTLSDYPIIKSIAKAIWPE